MEELNTLLKKIIEYKGRYTQNEKSSEKSSEKSKRIRLSLPIAYHEIFDHKIGKSSLKDKMGKVIRKYSKDTYNVFK